MVRQRGGGGEGKKKVAQASRLSHDSSAATTPSSSLPAPRSQTRAIRDTWVISLVVAALAVGFGVGWGVRGWADSPVGVGALPGSDTDTDSTTAVTAHHSLAATGPAAPDAVVPLSTRSEPQPSPTTTNRPLPQPDDVHTVPVEVSGGSATLDQPASAALAPRVPDEPADPAQTPTLPTTTKVVASPTTPSTIQSWAAEFRSSGVGAMAANDISALRDTFSHLPTSLFGALGDIAATEKSVESIPDKLLAHVRALRVGQKKAVPADVENFLWWQLAEATRLGDTVFRGFFAEAVVTAGVLTHIDRSNSRGYTNLHQAADAGDAAVARVLLLGGADVNRRTRNDAAVTPLHIALDRWAMLQELQHGRECTTDDFHSIVMALASHPALDLSVVDGRGRGLVYAAVARRHYDAAATLLRRAATHSAALVDARLPTTNGTALHAAADCFRMQVTAAKWTTWHRVDTPEAPGAVSGGETAAGSTGGCRHDSVSEFNISDGEVLRRPVRHHDHNGVGTVVRKWSGAFVELVLQHGGSVTAVDKTGRTALHVAADAGSVPAATALLQSGADPTAQDTYGNYPHSRAMHAGFTALATLLAKAAGVEPPRQPRNGTVTRPRFEGGDESDLGGWGPARSTSVLPGEDATVATCDFDVRANLTLAAFRDEYWSKGRPVLIQGGLLGLPTATLDKWHRGSFRDLFGDLEFRAAKVRSNRSAETLNTTFAQYNRYIDAVASKLGKGAAQASPSSQMIVEPRWRPHTPLHSAVMSLLRPPSGARWLGQVAAPLGYRLHNYQLNIGAVYSGTQLHAHYATMSALLHGAKRWSLYPPAHGFFSSAHFKEDFADITGGHLGEPLQCTQLSGDVLFLPTLWAHGALYEETSVSVSFLYTYDD